MQYLVLLGGDEARGPVPGTPEWDEDMVGYERFDEVAGDAILAGEALEPAATSITVRRDEGGAPAVTAGPFAETVEVLGGLYVLEADTLDDAIALAREIPAAGGYGWVAIRPMVMWEAPPDGATPGEGTRYVAFIYGDETEADRPGTAAWDAGATEHGHFVARAGDRLLGAGAVHPVDSTTTVRVRDGELLVTDGPYSEAAEVTGGFYLISAATGDEAVALAAAIPVGRGGAVELRPVMEME
jgi:hypothetical protein